MPNTVKFDQDYPDISQSQALYARATGLMPAYTQTLAKGPTQYVDGVAPKYLQRAKGSRVWDVDGNEYIDYSMGIGPISLGYSYDVVDEAVRRQLADGITFSLVHPLEVEVSELVREVIPNAEMVRIAKAGAEVTSAAVRAARAYTGRDKVLCCGYHGWHDWYIGITARDYGVPQAVKDLVHTFSYNNMDSVLAGLDSETAAVILEPMTFDFPKDDFLHRLKDACQANGTLLIFDEMWTGFRWALGGAQEAFGVVPDLACYSKAIANGMPIAVLTGRADVMRLFDEHIFFFTTFGGEALSLAAARATIHELREKEVPAYLARQGQVLIDGYNEIADELGIRDYTFAKGHPARGIINFDDKGGEALLMKSVVQQELLRHGILWSGFHNMCYSHTDADVEYTLEAYRRVLPVLRAGLESNDLEARLRGRPVQPVFRRTGDFNIKPKVK
jgi:glutamate-1-semialdehyde aminotransferase